MLSEKLTPFIGETLQFFGGNFCKMSELQGLLKMVKFSLVSSAIVRLRAVMSSLQLLENPLRKS